MCSCCVVRINENLLEDRKARKQAVEVENSKFAIWFISSQYHFWDKCCLLLHFICFLLALTSGLCEIMWGLPYQGRRESGRSHFQKNRFLDCLTVAKVTPEALQTARTGWWQNSSVLCLHISVFSVRTKLEGLTEHGDRECKTQFCVF